MNIIHGAFPEVLEPFNLSISFNPEDQQATVKTVAQKIAHLYAKCLTLEGYMACSEKFAYNKTPPSSFPIQDEVEFFEHELAKTIEEKLTSESSEGVPILRAVLLQTKTRPIKILKDVLQHCGIWAMPGQPFYFPPKCTNHIFLYKGEKIDITVLNL